MRAPYRAGVTTLANLAQKAPRAQTRIGLKPRPQIVHPRVKQAVAWLPGPVRRHLKASRDIFTDGLAVDPDLAGDNGHLQTLAM
jgi:hypothetical protein